MAPNLTVPLLIEPFGPAGTQFGPYTVPGFPTPGHPDYVEGTDLTLPLRWWLSHGIGINLATGYSLASGTSLGDMGRITIPDRGVPWWLEDQGFHAGLHSQAGSPGTYINPDDGGPWQWPSTMAHGYQYVRFIIDGELRSDDPTNYDDGVRPVKTNAGAWKIATTVDSKNAVLATALTPALVTRHANTGGATLQAVDSAGNRLYPGGVRGTRLLTIGVDRKAITTADAALSTQAAATVTIYFTPIYPERAPGYQSFSLEAPGSWNGVERACMNRHIRVESANEWGRIRGNNIDGENGIDAHRESWHGFFIRSTEDLIVSNIYLARVFGDGVNFGPSNQADLDNVDTQCDRIEFHGTRFNTIGRHWVTGQGQNRARMWRCVITDGKNLGCDNESTSALARAGHTKFDECVIGVDEALWHMSPAAVPGEPPRFVSIEAEGGSEFITVEPNEVIDQDMLGYLEADGILADGTYVLSRRSPTVIELNQEAIADGLTDAMLGPGTGNRDWEWRKCLTIGAPPNLAGDIAPTRSKVYATGITHGPLPTLSTVTMHTGSPILTCPAGDWSHVLDDIELYEGATVAERNPANPTAAITAAQRGIPLGAKILTVDSPTQVTLTVNCTKDKTATACVATLGSPWITDVEWTDRDDGLTYDHADIPANAKLFPVEPSLFPGFGQATGEIPAEIIAGKIRMPVGASKGSPAADRTYDITAFAGEREIKAATNTWDHPTDKGHLITCPSLLKDGTVHDAGTGKTAKISRPAKASGTATATESRRTQFFFQIGPILWTGFTAHQLRHGGFTRWTGDIVDGPNLQPLFMAPYLTDGISITECFGVANLGGGGAQIHHGLGGFNGPGSGVYYGQPPYADHWTATGNRLINMIDNQAGDPDVDVDLVLTVDDDESAEPQFTIVGARSDDASLEGHGVSIHRLGPNGWVIADGAVFDDTNTAHCPVLEPLADGSTHTYKAVWGIEAVNEGGLGTRAGVSNTIVIHVGGVPPVATTTALVAAPPSLVVEGTLIALTATVTPDPSENAGTVTFKDGATTIGTAAVSVGGTAVLTLPAGLAAGSHSLTSVFDGNDRYLTSTSSPVPYTTTVAPADEPTTTTLTADVASPQPIGTTITLTATIAPTVPGGTVEFSRDGHSLGVVTVTGSAAELDVVLDEEGTLEFDAEYSGTPGFEPSDDTLAFTAEEPPDLTPPEVIATDPYDGEIDVTWRNPPIGLFFSDPMGTVVAELRNVTAIPFQVVPCAFVPIGDGSVWTGTPAPTAGRLEASATYRIVIQDGTNEDGVHLAGQVVATFTTEPFPSTPVPPEMIPTGILVAR